jgi:hypothetical protein
VAEEEREQLSDEELIERAQEELRRLKVSDMIVQSLTAISSLGYHKLSPGEDRDLEQARLAIETLRAVLPVLEGSVPEQTHKDFSQLVSNMQLAYASAAAGRPEEPAGDG